MPVSVCRVADANPTGCGGSAAGFDANDWAMGWIIFADDGTASTVGAFQPTLTQPDTLISAQQAFAAGDATRPRIIDGASTPANVITYRPDGLRVPGGAQVAFAIAYPQDTPASCRRLLVNVTGQARIERVAC